VNRVIRSSILALASMTFVVGTSYAQSQAPSETKAFRHDPFESLLASRQSQAIGDPAPGIGGLVISTLRLNGIVKSTHGLIAVVTNPTGRTYFLHEGDQLYDGRVQKISVDGVSFAANTKDAFGNANERQVNKRIYSSAGEQQ